MRYRELEAKAGQNGTADSASFEQALAAFRRALPDCGFKLVVPPPRPGLAGEAFASVWRRSEDHAVSRRGNSPTEALLEAARAGSEDRQVRERLLGCNLCRGLGWFVAKGGGHASCDHRSSAALCKDNPAPGY